MTSEYAPASDTTLALFRKDIAGGEQLETIRISRVVLGEIFARLDIAEAALTDVYRWATTNHGGTKRPIDIWPGLAAALALTAARCDGCSEPNRCGPECPGAQMRCTRPNWCVCEPFNRGRCRWAEGQTNV